MLNVPLVGFLKIIIIDNQTDLFVVLMISGWANSCNAGLALLQPLSGCQSIFIKILFPYEKLFSSSSPSWILLLYNLIIVNIAFIRTVVSGVLEHLAFLLKMIDCILHQTNSSVLILNGDIWCFIHLIFWVPHDISFMKISTKVDSYHPNHQRFVWRKGKRQQVDLMESFEPNTRKKSTLQFYNREGPFEHQVLASLIIIPTVL